MRIRKILIGKVCNLNASTLKSTEKPRFIKYLDTSNITNNIIGEIKMLDGETATFPSRAQRKVKSGTIIYSTVRPILEHYGFIENPEENLIVSTGFLTLDVIDKGIDPKFLYYSLTRKNITYYLHKIAVNNVSSYPAINPDDVGNIELEIPNDKNIQESIAHILSTLDSKIYTNTQINKLLESIAKTLYEYWFLQFEFPDNNGQPYKSSGGKMIWNEELKREIPEGWEVGIASDLFDFNPTYSLKKGQNSFYIDMDALPTDGFMISNIQKKGYNGGTKFQNGDLIIARITPCLENGKTGLVTLLNDNEIGFGSTEYIVLRGKNRSLSGFASFLSRSIQFRKYAITNMTGTSGRKRIDSKVLEKFPLPIPQKDILDKFEEIISKFFQQETINTIQNQELTTLRDWLLPMLMNGQVKIREENTRISNPTSEVVQQDVLPI